MQTKDKTPLVSIITVVYNGEKYLEQTIESVINQTYKNIEYIIIDGESTDKTLEIIKKYEKYISFWISEPDKGLYDAMNKGIKIAKGELIGMINSDDWYESNAVDIMVNAYKNNPTKSIFHADRYDIDQNGDKKIRRFNKSSFKFKYYGMTYNHPSMFITKTEYAKHLYNIELHSLSDYQFILEAFLRDRESIFYVNNPIVNYRLSGISSKISSIKSKKESYVARKNSGMNFFSCIFALIFGMFINFTKFFRKKNNNNILNIGFFYKHIDDKGGYPRDISRLYIELQKRDICMYKLKSFWDLLKIRNKIDCIHIFALFLPVSIITSLYCKIFKIPYIISPLSQLMPFAMKKKSFKKYTVFNLIVKYLLNSAKFIHVFTHTEKDALRNLGITSEIRIITFGIYPEDIVSQNQQKDMDSFHIKKPYIIFLGRLDIYQKGIDILIDGFEQYMNTSTKFSLVICGQDYQGGREIIENRISNTNSQDRIIFLGEVTEEEKDILIEKAEAFIYPSRFDGPPRPIRFAISKKQKVLISYQSNIIDNLEQYGWGLQFEANSQSICKCILDFERINTFPPYKEPMSILSWEKLALDYEKMYKNLK